MLVPLADSCAICRRSEPLVWGTYVRVSWPDGSVREVCDLCMERADEGLGVDETLDYSEEEDE